MLFLFLCGTVILIIVLLYANKIKELNKELPLFKNILTDTQARIASSLKNSPIEILGKHSIIDKIKSNIKGLQISFIGEKNHEDLIKQMAIKFLDRGSIMRKIGIVTGEIKNDISECFIQDDKYALYENGTVGLYEKKSGVKPLKANIPINNLAFTIQINNLEKISDLESYGKAVGQIFAVYENSVFIKMLEGSGKVQKFYANDEASIISTCLRLKLKGDYIFILPASFKNTVNIFDEEIKSMPEMNNSYHFVNDLSLSKLGVKALLLKKEDCFKVIAAQQGEIYSSLLELNNQVYLQSFIEAGYCSSGIEESIIFKNSSIEGNLT